jgi:signal recognition particle subunit SRP14
MVRLEPDPFLSELHRMFERSKKKGAVWITMKRSALEPPSRKKQAAAEDHCCLIRASDGKRKISTTLTAAQHVKFQNSYVTLLRAHIDNLKKRDKSKAGKEAPKKQAAKA